MAFDPISAGIDLLGGAFGASASKKAADAQKKAADQQNALFKQGYYTSLGMNDPYYLTGTGANNALAQMWGLPYQDARSATDIANSYNLPTAHFSSKQVVKMMKQGMSIDDIAKLGSINVGAHGTKRLVKHGVTADQIGTLTRGPTGQVPTPDIHNAPGSAPDGSSGQPNFNALLNTPAYQWNLQQGLGAVNNQNNALGGLYSGNNMRALQATGAGIASNEFWNVNNFLNSLSGRGERVAGQNQQAGQFYNSGGANALQQRGDAQAGGILGAANSWQAALNAAGQGLGSTMRQSGVGGNSVYPGGGAPMVNQPDYGVNIPNANIPGLYNPAWGG